MTHLREVTTKRSGMNTIVNLTGVFEGIASMRIAQVKNQVLQSQQFFSELWQIYTQLREGEQFHFGRQKAEKVIEKQLYIVVTSEGNLSGDIDHKLISWMLEQYNPDLQDIMVIGRHGAQQLIQRNVSFKKYFTLPSRDRNVNVQPLVNEIRRYASTVVFYQAYVSLMVQDVKRIELQTAVAHQGQKVRGVPNAEVISEHTYIFEPSTYEVVAYLERSMLQIALSQVILDSKLAQYASRFRAMSTAHDKAGNMNAALITLYNQTKRRTQDERLKETVNSLRMRPNHD